MSDSSSYDGIVLGTGHNVLVLQAYLCRCGLRVLSLDRAAVAGGGLATVENPRLPGFWHNTHAFFHRAATAMPWYRDLELERHGATYIEPELNVAQILPDGRSLQWWTDLDRTVESFARFSARDAATLRRWADEFVPIVERILVPEAQSPPLPEERRRQLLERSALGRRLLEVSALSPLEFVEREFENDVVKAGLLFFNGLREVDLRLRGFGHSIPALLAGKHKAQMCVGGSARLAQALVRDIQVHGGDVRTGCEPRSILVRNGRAVGVELTSGERIEAERFVASGLNPQQTFLTLLDADCVDAECQQETGPICRNGPQGASHKLGLSPFGTLRERAAGFGYNLLAPLFAVNVALREPPRYRAAENDPSLDRAFMVILGLERFAQFHEIVAAHERGEMPATVMWGACPTLFDPSQAPAGQHTGFMWEKLPYALHGDPRNWDAARDEHGQQMLRLWCEYAPNLAADGVVLDVFCRSPLDIQRTLPNMQCGDLLVGSFDHGQIRSHRPFPGAGRYRTPLDGLYLCGGSTHPGGNITGLCGYNAARVIAADVGAPQWWATQDVEGLWAAMGG